MNCGVRKSNMKLNIIDEAMRLMNLLEQYGDEEFAEIVCSAVFNFDIGMLLDLEESLEE